jgi:mRNA interferase HigB
VGRAWKPAEDCGDGQKRSRNRMFPEWELVLPFRPRERPLKVVGRSILAAFCSRHADARAWVQSWLAEVEVSNWTHPQQIKARFASASFLSDNRVIFNVKGNRYRLEAVIAFRAGIVIVEWAGTHADYDARSSRR